MSDPSPMPMPMPMPVQSAPALASSPSAPSPPSGGLWDSVDGLHAWLNTHRAVVGQEALLLRVLKLSEEVGEVGEVGDQHDRAQDRTADGPRT
ncbi:hypothetical protein ACFPZI_03405 [Streptomyces chlorus]|uniref:Uncharacterized protein n=1 Tax=Streptomyces chlorus TaxID=887452 RepID=A0ABW1DSY0_9ACTN